MKVSCINPELGRKLSLEIAFNVARGVGVFLSPEHCRHLMECDCCREELPLLFKKASATQKSMQAYEIFKSAEAGRAGIVRRTISDGTALFRPYENDPTRGLYVLVDAENKIYDAEEMSAEQFNQLK